MTTSTELIPVSGRVSSMYPQYRVDEPQYQQSNYQPWSTDAAQEHLVSKPNVKENESGSCRKHLTTKLLTSILIGLVVCGIPLAIVSSLYVQKKSSSSTNTGNTDSSGSSSSLPTQCTSYTVNGDPTRLTTYTSCGGCYYDTSPYIQAGWYRFVDGAGTQLATMPSSSGTCGASYAGWYNGSFPLTSGSTTTGAVCVFYNNNLCYSSYTVSSVSVTNCNGYYVFYLTPMSTSITRYCTSF